MCFVPSLYHRPYIMYSNLVTGQTTQQIIHNTVSKSHNIGTSHTYIMQCVRAENAAHYPQFKQIRNGRNSIKYTRVFVVLPCQLCGRARHQLFFMKGKLYNNYAITSNNISGFSRKFQLSLCLGALIENVIIKRNTFICTQNCFSSLNGKDISVNLAVLSCGADSKTLSLITSLPLVDLCHNNLGLRDVNIVAPDKTKES